MKTYITAKEAAALTDLATNTITLAAQQGLIGGYKSKGKWLLLSQDVVNLNKNPHKKGVKRERQQIGGEERQLHELGAVSLFEQSFTPRRPKHASIHDTRELDELPLYSANDLKKQYLLGVKHGIEYAQKLRGKTDE